MRENQWNECEIVQDLLPLYVDGVCNAGSHNLVEEHLKECIKCSSYHKQLLNSELDEQYEEVGNTVMKKHKRKFINFIVILVVLGFALGLFTMKIGIYAFNQQYHHSGISKYLNITISDTGKYKVGELEGYDIYLEDLSEAYFVTLSADRLELKDAIEQGKINMEDLYDGSKHMQEILANGQEGIIYYFENYQIELLKDECVISPIRE